MDSRSVQSSYDPDDLSWDEDEYGLPTDEAEMTPGRSDRAARSLTAATFYQNSPPELQQNWGQKNLNFHDYHSDPMEISSTFWLPDITDWWQRQEETHSKYADLSYMACDIFSIILQLVGVEASNSLGQDVSGWRESETSGETLHEHVVVKQFSEANSGLYTGDDPVLDPSSTEN